MREWSFLSNDQVKSVSRLLRKESVAFRSNDGTKYLGYLDKNKKVIAVVGYKDMGKNHVRFKVDWVHPNYRGNGYYKKLFSTRIKYVKDFFPNLVKISAYCTEKSVNVYIENGFQASGKNGHGHTFVIKHTTK